MARNQYARIGFLQDRGCFIQFCVILLLDDSLIKVETKFKFPAPSIIDVNALRRVRALIFSIRDAVAVAVHRISQKRRQRYPYGDVNARGAIIIGDASESISSSAMAQGVMTVTNGDIVVEEGDDVSALGVGTAIFDGADATGTLTVNQGSITARRILVGIPNLARNQSPIVNGTLIVNDGDISFSTMEIGANGVVAASGVSSLNGRPVTSRLQQFGGIANGQSLMLGELGEIVLGIGGPSAGDDYAQIQVEDATLDGLIELRFVDGYEPQPGDVFDLIDANELSADYTVVATGLDPQRLANLEVNEVGSQNGLMLALVVVPEPDRATLFLCAICGFITSRRSEVRRASSFEGPVEQQL